VKNLKILSPEILDKYGIGITPTLAIVGNGGVSLEDEENIMTADCVIRFNNYASRENITKTKDRLKCDILFSTFDLHSQGSNPRDVVVGIPYPFKAKDVQRKQELWYPKAQKWMVNPYENMDLCDELGLNSVGYHHPLPSLGLTALYHLNKMNCNMFVCGFAWYYDEQRGLFQKHHLKNKNYPSVWNHNYCKELIWILDNLYGKPNVSFSKSCTRLLSIARSQLNER